MYHVLIVDSDPLVRKLTELLITSGNQYRLAPSLGSVTMAENYCAEASVDLILLDMMTAMDTGGPESIRKLKQYRPQQKIILTTSLPEFSFLDRARQSGADSFWYKEPSAESLLGIMNRTLAGETVFPENTPEVRLGSARSIDFTGRELEVLREVMRGKTDAAIAEKLNLSVATVKFHIQKIREKTGFTNRTELAVRTQESGLVISR